MIKIEKAVDLKFGIRGIESRIHLGGGEKLFLGHGLLREKGVTAVSVFLK